MAVGVGSADRIIDASRTGTFAGYGVDVPVTLSGDPGDRLGEPEPLPLCALMAGWIRAQACPRAAVTVRVYAADQEAAGAVAAGRGLRRELDADAEPVGVLVLADGANTLTPPPPAATTPNRRPCRPPWTRSGHR